MAGFTQARNDIDQRAGTLAIQLRQVFVEIDAFHDYLNTMPDQTLKSPPQSYSDTEIAQLKSAFGDLSRLAAIYRGEQGVPDAYDFRTFAKLLTGVL